MISDKRLNQDKEDRKEKSNPVSAASKARGAKVRKKADMEPGDIMLLKSDGDKHTARDPLLVTMVEDSKVTMQKVLHSSHLHKAAPRINSQKLRIDKKFL